MKQRLSTLIQFTHNNFIINGSRRYSGHSKWQNIKHTKQEQDAARSNLFKSLITKMTAVVKETGEADPSFNTRLAKLVDQAKKANMPVSTLNSFFERMKTQKNEKLYVMPVRTASGCTLLIHAVSDNLSRLNIILNTIYKKQNLKPADSAISMFDCASYITASKDCSLDQATDDAIIVGAEDVQEVKHNDKSYFQFKVEFLFPDKVQTQLLNLGYCIDSIEHRSIPNSVVKLNDEQLDEINRLKAKLLELDVIEKVEDNIAP